jgi:receptor-type tyrosine-protein phosphatase gamma
MNNGFLINFFFFFICRKCVSAANYFYIDDPPYQPQTMIGNWEEPVEIDGEIRTSIAVSDFAKHVAQLHCDSDIGFSKEYDAIQNEANNDEYPSEHSQHPDNKGKNRYLNIIACK